MLKEILDLSLSDRVGAKIKNYGLYSAFVDEENPFAGKINDAFKGYTDAPRWWQVRPLAPRYYGTSEAGPEYSNLILAQGIWYESELNLVLRSIKKNNGKHVVPSVVYASRYEGRALVFNFQAQIDFLAFLLEKKVLEAKSFEVYGLRKLGWGYKIKSSSVNLESCTISVVGRQKCPLIDFEVKMPY